MTMSKYFILFKFKHNYDDHFVSTNNNIFIGNHRTYYHKQNFKLLISIYRY